MSELMRKPDWLKVSLPANGELGRVRGLLRGLELHTVCQSAMCPNLGHCFASGTATFMILGDLCTRVCGFCAVAKGRPAPLDSGEPERVAEAARQLGLSHVVVTSVTRDDLPDGGAAHFATTIEALRRAVPGASIEVLIPDLRGDPTALEAVLAAGPTVLNHNVETVPRLYPRVRPQADYRRSLEVLRRAKGWAAGRAAGGAPGGVAGTSGRAPLTKSGLMVGLGETPAEVSAVMEDLRQAGCDLLTIGQYLRPSRHHLPVEEYVPPEVFEQYQRRGEALGFAGVFAGPLVRSSFHAGEVLRGVNP